MQLGEFLTRVLPGDGYKCWVEIRKNKKVLQGFVPTIEELALKLAEIDARGVDAYFACASYQTTANRKGANALQAKAYWMDVDVGEGKPYATADEAVQACDEFCARAGLPLPAVVRSGGGIHTYWLLNRPLTADAWRGAAQRLKLLADNYGFHADPSRTADIASILRPPGTKNYKLSEARSVEIEEGDGWEPVDTVAFLEAILKAPVAGMQPAHPSPNHPETQQTGLTNSSLLTGISKAFDSTKGVARGARGSTQLKYAGELVAKGYPEREVLKRCLEWNTLCTPPQEDKEVLRIVRSALSMHAAKHPLPPTLQVWEKPPLPRNYFWGPQNQLMVEVEAPTDDGETRLERRVIAPYPVHLAAILRYEHGDRRNSYLFRQYNPVDGWHEFCMESEQFNTQNWYAAWFKNGGSIHTGMEKYFRTCVRETEIMLRPILEVPRYSQFGWKEDNKGFLVGDTLFRAGQPVRAHGTDRLTPMMHSMALPKEGSLEEWTAAADKFFAPGMEAHAFALLTSFAAPLMKFCAGLSDGGSILSLVSAESGQGKTPTAEAIASVWGTMDAVRVTGTDTANSRLEGLVRRCNLPQVQEETLVGDPKMVAEQIKAFTTGSDKARLNRDGSSKGIIEHFQSIVVHIGNSSLFDTVKLVDGPAARRIFELDMRRPENPAVFSNLGGITREMMRCRAFAGRRYAQILTDPRIVEYLLEHLTGKSEERAGSVIMKYRHLTESSAEHRFLIWLLSTINVGGILANHYNLLHFDVDRIMEWAVPEARTCTRAVDVATDPEGVLQRFLGDNNHSCLVVSDAWGHGVPITPLVEPRGKLLMRLEIKPQRLYISNDALLRWCTSNNALYKSLCEALMASGIAVERSRHISLGAGTHFAMTRCYCLTIDLSHPAISGVMRAVVAQTGQEKANGA